MGDVPGDVPRTTGRNHRSGTQFPLVGGYAKMPGKKCRECGSFFIPTAPRQCYCAGPCSELGQIRYDRAYSAARRATGQDRGIVVEKACDICGDRFQGQNARVKCCSVECTLVYDRIWKRGYASGYKSGVADREERTSATKTRETRRAERVASK